MEMPDKYTINPDGSLTVYVDSQEYVFSKNQFLKSDKGRILLKHQAVAMLAEMTGVKVREPVLLSNYNPVIYVFSRTAVRGNETFAAVGESNRKNLFCDVMMMTHKPRVINEEIGIEIPRRSTAPKLPMETGMDCAP